MWEQILVLFNHSHFLLFTIGTMAALGLSFWITNAFFMYLDVTGKPKFLHKYKIQDEKNAPVNWKLFQKCLGVINKNQLVASIMILLIYPLTLWRGMPFETTDLPTLPKLLLELALFGIFEEFAFYYLHSSNIYSDMLHSIRTKPIGHVLASHLCLGSSLYELMHHPYLYKHIHKVHHEWTAPISIAVVYVHPIEHVVVNMLPVLSFPILLRSHLLTSWLWYFLATFVSSVHHSGYHFPGLPSPEFHDYHHLKFNNCFGVLGFLDWLHNTDVMYRKTKQFKNDHMYFSLKPVWKLH